MIDTPTPARDEIAAQLWRWLPGLYRARDDDGRLGALLALFGDELWRLRRLIEQQQADHFIDSAQDWVIPYLADLVGTSVLFTGDAAALAAIAARNRADVKNTMLRRRQKGTLAGLEAAAHDAGGLGVLAAEMFERCCWMQNLAHIKPQASFTLDLRQGAALAAATTPYAPFSKARALVDWRPAGPRQGWHRVDQVLAFEWPIASHPLAAVPPHAAVGGWHFHPLGLDSALHAGGATAALRKLVAARPGAVGADILNPHADHVPIRRRDLHEHAQAYVDSPLGFAIREDGIALVGGAPAAAPSTLPAQDHGALADRRGMLPSDASVYPAGVQAELAAVRLGAVFVLFEGVLAPVPYSPGQPLASQLQLRAPQGRLTLDTLTPDFGYIAGNMPYEPTTGEFHHPALLLRLSNQGAAPLALPASEAILRNERGLTLQVFLPAVAALAPGAEFYCYIADDGSSYFARGDHGPGAPDRNPDSSLYGAFRANHLARAAEGQRRIRPGHPAGAARWRRVVARSLCCWDQPLVPPLAAGEVAVDPERGRFAFPAGEQPAGELNVDFRVALTHTLGAGAYARPGLPTATLTVAKQRDADFQTIQAAIDAAPDGGTLPVVIELLDSARYEEALRIDARNFPGGLVIQAAALQTPFIVKPVAAAQLLRVAGSSIAALTLDGLAFADGALQIGAGVAATTLRQCTLLPQNTSLALAWGGLTLAACICGPVTLAAAAGPLVASDSVLQHPAATVEQPSAGRAISHPGGEVALERCSVVGDVVAATASLSNTLLWGAFVVATPGCLRFSRLPAAVAATAFRCTRATPIFVSLRCGDAGWMHLHPNSGEALLRGAAEGGEIGAFHAAGLPWRVQSAGARLAENLPAGLRPLQVQVLPGQRFPGLRAAPHP